MTKYLPVLHDDVDCFPVHEISDCTLLEDSFVLYLLKLYNDELIISVLLV